MASKSYLQRTGSLRSGKHLVAIYHQSSPSTPGQGHSRIDTGPGEKYNILKLKSEIRRIITENVLHLQNTLFISFFIQTVLPRTPPCWVCSCVEFWQHRRCPPCSGTESSQGECCRHRRYRCGHHRYCRRKDVFCWTSSTDCCIFFSTFKSRFYSFMLTWAMPAAWFEWWLSVSQPKPLMYRCVKDLPIYSVDCHNIFVHTFMVPRRWIPLTLVTSLIIH